jgi:hypothetical protein
MSSLALALPTTSPAGGSLCLLRASSDDELRAAATFRQSIFLERRGVAFDELLEARRDRAGHVFLLLHDGRPVATARVLPHPSHLSTLKELAPDLGSLGADSQVGRIAALPSSDGIPHSISLLALGAAWLLENTGLRRYVAHCHPKLLDLYRLAGAEVVGGPCPVPGRTDPHLIITGRYDDAAAAAVRPSVRGGV